MFVTYYLQNVEGVRQDVTHIRPHGLWSAWYVESIEDAELREVSQALWREITSDFDLHHPGTPEFWQGTALFAHRLAEHYRGRRTVYALHGPGTELIPGPPYFVGLRDDLWRLDFNVPDLMRAASAGEPMARFPGGLDLISLEFDTAEPEAGDLVEFRARWHLRSRLSGAILGIRLVPAHTRESPDAGSDGDRWERLSEKGLFLQGFPVLHCLYGLAPSPPGTVYEQQGRLMIPSNAQAGEYRLALGFAQSYPPKYEHWMTLPEDHSILVCSRPLPAN
jgi:hypothetical protein